MLDLGTGETKRVSSGEGKTTCGWFFYPGGERIRYVADAFRAGCGFFFIAIGYLRGCERLK